MESEVSQSGDNNPYAVSAAWDELSTVPDVLPVASPGRKFTFVLLIIILLTYLLGGTAAFVSMESIMVSGAVLIVASCALWISENRWRKRGGQPCFTIRVLAMSGLVLVITVFGVIVSSGMSPAGARQAGIDDMCGLAGMLGTVFSVVTLLSVPDGDLTAVEDTGSVTTETEIGSDQ